LRMEIFFSPLLSWSSFILPPYSGIIVTNSFVELFCIGSAKKGIPSCLSKVKN
jgi:hypothetical protein